MNEESKPQRENVKRALTVGELRKELNQTVRPSITSDREEFLIPDEVIVIREGEDAGCYVFGHFELLRRTCEPTPHRILRLLEKLERQTTENTEQLKLIMAKSSDIQAQLDAMGTQVDGIATSLVAEGQQLTTALSEINDELATLQGEIGNADVPQSLVDSANSLATKIGNLAAPVQAIGDAASKLDAINPAASTSSSTSSTTPAPAQ